MDGKTLNMKLFMVACIATLLASSYIGTAYAFSSSVSIANNSVDATYLSIDVYQKIGGGVETNASSVVFYDYHAEIEGDNVIYTPTNENAKYTLRVFSNEFNSGYIYGYYECPDYLNGVAVKSITLVFDLEYEETNSYTVYRDVFTDDYHLVALSGSPEKTADAPIEKIIVEYYPLSYISDTAAVIHGEAGEEGEIDPDAEGEIDREDAESLENFRFHFYVSPNELF